MLGFGVTFFSFLPHVKSKMAKGDGERETPDVAGKRLQAQLDVLCPNLKVLVFTHMCVCVVVCVCVSVGICVGDSGHAWCRE